MGGIIKLVGSKIYVVIGYIIRVSYCAVERLVKITELIYAANTGCERYAVPVINAHHKAGPMNINIWRKQTELVFVGRFKFCGAIGKRTDKAVISDRAEIIISSGTY